MHLKDLDFTSSPLPTQWGDWNALEEQFRSTNYTTELGAVRASQLEMAEEEEIWWNSEHLSMAQYV